MPITEVHTSASLSHELIFRGRRAYHTAPHWAHCGGFLPGGKPVCGRTDTVLGHGWCPDRGDRAYVLLQVHVLYIYQINNQTNKKTIAYNYCLSTPR